MSFTSTILRYLKHKKALKFNYFYHYPLRRYIYYTVKKNFLTVAFLFPVKYYYQNTSNTILNDLLYRGGFLMKLKKMFSIITALCLTGQMLTAGQIFAEEDTKANEFTYGDINGDLAADLTDLSLLSIYLMGGKEFTDIQKKAADVDGNDEIDIRDLAHFKRYICKDKVTLGPQGSSMLKLKQASDYEDFYPLLKNTNNNYNMVRYSMEYAGGQNAVFADKAIENSPVPDYADVPTASASTDDNNSVQHSDTYNQEENVLESDIVKTDGNTIYTLSQDYMYGDYASLNAVDVKDGMFEESQTINLDLSDCKFGKAKAIHTENMYLYNDMIIVLGNASVTIPENSTSDIYYSHSKDYTFVSAYTKGTKDKAPELIDTYYQEGRFYDVRITPDGYMYLISTTGFNYYYYNTPWLAYDYYSTKENNDETYNEEDVKEFIPSSGTNTEISAVPLEQIYIPETIDDTCSDTFTIVGSIDLNSKDTITQKDIKVITGYSGEIYCHENNLYLTHERYDSFYHSNRKRTTESSHEVTEITRIALNDGTVTPEATGEVPGYVNDQFSMSEYEGNFRIVTTCNYYHYAYNNDGCYYDFIDKSERSNFVFVLDMDLNKIGEIGHFAKDEMVKSVSFDGNIGYVVTFVQTDPLFAVDLSDPANPAILDEFKIDGFSTYMQKWDDGHLLGFGKTVTDNREDGYKIVMFDNSDPEDLKEDGIFEIKSTDLEKLAEILGKSDLTSEEYDIDCWLSSEAAYDRKALLIAPEKNLIGFPIDAEAVYYSKDYTEFFEKKSSSSTGYYFFSYEDGEFKFKNYLNETTNYNYGYNCFNRALYIGDYVYIVSDNELISADIDTCTMTDKIFIDPDKIQTDIMPVIPE